MDWSGKQFIWTAGSGNIHRHISELAAVIYEVTLAVNRIGAGYDFEQMLVHVLRLLIFYLIGHIKITFFFNSI